MSRLCAVDGEGEVSSGGIERRENNILEGKSKISVHTPSHTSPVPDSYSRTS